MKLVKTEFSGLHLVRYFSSEDARGGFVKPWIANGLSDQFNDLHEVYCTQSNKGVLRGLHYQAGSYAQKKYVTCLDGVIEDIALDLRSLSPTFGKVFRKVLRGMDGNGVLIPEGFAHAIFAHEDSVTLTCCDNAYCPQHEKGINWMSIDAISDLQVTSISEKDLNLPPWSLLDLEQKNE
jgi:dTDP-4-dehydrorhamnose 3,5-epimerase